MISPKRLIEMAKKRGVSSTKANAGATSDPCPASIADKGHFIVYSVEGKRFMVPLAYLKSNVFRELLRMSEDEFGYRGDGPIILPCDAGLLEYALSVLRSRVSKDVEKKLFSSLLTHHCSASLSLPGGDRQQFVVSGF